MTELGYIGAWARAFGLTLAVELCVAVPLLKREAPDFRRRAVTVTLAQLATHPVVWFVLPAFVRPRVAYLGVAEVFATATEALFYTLVFSSMTWRRATAISIIANAASLTAGLALRALGAGI